MLKLVLPLLPATTLAPTEAGNAMIGGCTATAIGRRRVETSLLPAPLWTSCSTASPKFQLLLAGRVELLTVKVIARVAPGRIHANAGLAVPGTPLMLTFHRPPLVPGLRKVRVKLQVGGAQRPLAMLARFKVAGLPPVAGLAALKLAVVSFRTRPARIARSMRRRPEPRAKAFARVT